MPAQSPASNFRLTLRVCFFRPDGWASQHPEIVEKREWMGPDHPAIADASYVLKKLYENVARDVILTRENLDRAWVTKQNLGIYKCGPISSQASAAASAPLHGA